MSSTEAVVQDVRVVSSKVTKAEVKAQVRGASSHSLVSSSSTATISDTDGKDAGGPDGTASASVPDGGGGAVVDGGTKREQVVEYVDVCGLQLEFMFTSTATRKRKQPLTRLSSRERRERARSESSEDGTLDNRQRSGSSGRKVRRLSCRVLRVYWSMQLFVVVSLPTTIDRWCCLASSLVVVGLSLT